MKKTVGKNLIERVKFLEDKLEFVLSESKEKDKKDAIKKR